MIDKKSTPTSNIFNQIFNIKTHEIKATIASFLMVFILMACYFILRPVRDAMASDWSDSEVSVLWNLQFFVSATVISIYGYAITKVKFKNVVPIVYSFFAFSFIGFYLITQVHHDQVLVEKGFYIWVSAFSLFHISVFWSLMSDAFSKEQSKRLFAVIASGASAGALVGPTIPVLFAKQVGLETLMLIAAFCLLLVIPLVLYIYRLKTMELCNEQVKVDLSGSKLSKQWFSGFKSVVSNSYLLGVACFILLYVFIGSFIYFEQKNLLAQFSRPERAQILGSIDWIVNALTFIMAFFLTSRIVHKFGMPSTLALMPVLMIIGMVVLAFAPVIVILLGIQVSRRVGNYAVTRPAREMLFTQVTTDERFKAKPVIDIVVYRGGDAISGTLFSVLTEGLGLGLMVVSLIGAGIASVWAGLAVFIGQKYENNKDKHTKSPLSRIKYNDKNTKNNHSQKPEVA